MLVKRDIRFRYYFSYNVDKFYYFFPDFYIFRLLLLIYVLNL